MAGNSAFLPRQPDSQTMTDRHHPPPPFNHSQPDRQSELEHPPLVCTCSDQGNVTAIGHIINENGSKINHRAKGQTALRQKPKVRPQTQVPRKGTNPIQQKTSSQSRAAIPSTSRQHCPSCEGSLGQPPHQI